MKTPQNTAVIFLLLLISTAFYQKATAQAPTQQQVEVQFTGGYDTVPEDHGRPVILIASALGVPPQVFRDAFKKVKPAGPGREPEEKQVILNKQALLGALSPYDVTDDRLNEVSNYYRYSGARGQVWKRTPAKAVAIMTNNQVTGFKIIDGGNGYTTAPTVSVAGGNVKVKAGLVFGKDFTKNGSICELKIIP